MRRLALVLLLFVGCRRATPNEAKPEPASSAAPSPSPSAPSAPSAPAASAPPAASSAPLPTPPVATCAVHPDLHWDTDVGHPLIRDLRTASGWAAAPGTKLLLAHVAYAPGKPAADETPDEARQKATADLAVRYSAIGLPKGAVLDPTSGEVTYRIELASGDATAFTIVATATADPGKRCISTGVVLQALDDDEHRVKQAVWIARELWAERAGLVAFEAGKAKSLDDPDAGDDEIAKARNEASDRVRPATDYRDLDGDGQKDVAVTYGPAFDHDDGATLVLLRKKDTFFPLNRIPSSSVDFADDGTPLLVRRGGCCCHEDLKIHRVFPNRVQIVADVDLAGNCAEDKVGIDLTRGSKGIVAYVLTSTSGTRSKRELWKWNGKGFVFAP